MAEITNRIKMSTERDSLSHDFIKLKEKETQQAIEVQKLKHDEREVKLSHDEKVETTDTMERELTHNRNKVTQLTNMSKDQRMEIEALKKEASIYSEFKNIDMEELKMIYQTNMKMSSNMERFLNRMDNSSYQ